MHKDELLEILSYCDIQTIISFSLCCQAFNRYINKDYFWRSLCERDYGNEYKYFDRKTFKETYKSCIELDEYRLNIPNNDTVRYGKDEDRSQDIIAVIKLCPEWHSFYDVGEPGDATSLNPELYTFIPHDSKVFIFSKYNEDRIEYWDWDVFRVPLKYWCGGDYDYYDGNYDNHGRYGDDTIGIMTSPRTKFMFHTEMLTTKCIKQVNTSNDERISNHENVYKIEIFKEDPNLVNHIRFLRMLSLIEKLDRKIEYVSFWNAEIYTKYAHYSVKRYDDMKYRDILSYNEFRMIFCYWGNFLWVRHIELRN